MIKSGFSNLNLSNVQLRTDIESKHGKNTTSMPQKQSEDKIWQYMSSIGNSNAAVLSKTSFKGVQSAQKGNTPVDNKDLTPIKTKEEYLEVLNKVKNAKDKDGKPLWLSEEDLKFYPDATEIEQGLLPYCGHRDISNSINRYLSGRSEATPEMRDIVRALDYSLSELDKEAGSYKGIVFRQGYMDENTGQYLSTSKNPLCAARLNDGWFDPYDIPYRTYSVIKTKGGHDLSAFQSKMKDGFCNKEQEILLPHQAKYREVPTEECSEDLIKAKEDFASKLFRDAHKLFNGSKTQVKGYTKEDLLNMIKVYEEV